MKEMVIKSADKLGILDDSFRDYGIPFREIRHDRVSRTLHIPVIAPDWSQSVTRRRWYVFAEVHVAMRKWWIEFRHVKDAHIRFTEDPENMTTIEFGSLRFEQPGTILLMGQYVLDIRIEVECVDVALTADPGVESFKNWIRLNSVWRENNGDADQR